MSALPPSSSFLIILLCMQVRSVFVLPAYELPQQKWLSYGCAVQCDCTELPRLTNTQTSVPSLAFTSLSSPVFLSAVLFALLHFVSPKRSVLTLSLSFHSLHVLLCPLSLCSHFCPPVFSAKGKPLLLSHGTSRNGRIRSSKLREIHHSLSLSVASLLWL